MRVLISGGGIAGPSLALLLARAGGHQITILERAPEVLPYGQNIDVQGTARKVMANMGIRDDVLANNTTEKGTRMIDPYGRPFAPFPLQEGKMNSLTSEFEILRGDFTKFLSDATKNLQDIQWRFSTTIARVITNDERKVQVQLSNGSTGSYDIVVACDGQWSRLRKQTFPEESVRAVDLGVYGVYWTVPRIESDIPWWSTYMAGKHRIVSSRPDPHGTMRVAITCMPPAAESHKWRAVTRADRASQEKSIREVFAGAGWDTDRFLGELSSTPDYYFHDMKQIKMDTWSKNRIVCLGDTAWAPTPFTGAGTSLALVGAYVLAGEISKLPSGASPVPAFKAYEQQCRQHVEEQQKIPAIFPWLAHGNLYRRIFVQTVLRIVSYVAQFPSITSRFAGNDPEQEDFALPQYPRLESTAVSA